MAARTAILAIYSSQGGEPETAYQTLRALRAGPVSLFRDSGNVGKSDSKTLAYSELRLANESLVVIVTSADRVQAVVKTLENTGDPALFIFREEDDARKPAPNEVAILPYLKHVHKVLEDARSNLLDVSRLARPLTAAAEWILDNAYLIRTQVTEVRRHLPREYRKLPPARDVDESCPRIYTFAKELIVRTNFAVDQSNMTNYLLEAQREQPLKIAELWLFPLFLSVALIAGLAELAQRASRAQQLRELTRLWANRFAVAARMDSMTFDRIVRRLEAEPFALDPYFVTSLAEQLQEEEGALAPIQHWIEKRFNLTVTELVRREHTQEAVEGLSTANAFGSLRTLTRLDFAEIFEATSRVEAELRLDPGGVYVRSDFLTRDQCRRVVERIAWACGLPEDEVARRAVALAAAGDPSRGSHVAYYLLAEGITQLEEDTGARISLRMQLIRALRRQATVSYIGAICALTTCFVVVSCKLGWDAGVHRSAVLTILGALALFPLSELSSQILNALVISLLPPEHLPRMNFREGIPVDCATLVVVPMMLSSIDVIKEEVEKLEVRFLANQEKHIQFGLFSDFTDSPRESTPDDEGLVRAIRSGIEELNLRYAGKRFLLFHRARTWSESEQQWIGCERKRGKIEHLNKYLSGEGASDILLTGNLAERIQYVIMLDSDTQLPPSAARRLIETIAHPLNRVEIEPVTRRRLRGYAVIQPRISIALPGAIASRFTRIFAETTGTDPYCQAVSDAHQDLFGEATFHGKAIYEIQSFRQTVGDRFPAETILSHDLIEGAHAGVGLATDIELFENLPIDYAAYSKRVHRWIRGDWQIASWIFARVPSPKGQLVPNPLSWINRWRIFDNLRRSLVPVASLVLLLFGWITSAAPGTWSLVVGLAVVIPALAPLLDRLARRFQGTALRWHGSEAEFVRAIVAVAVLPHQAWIAVDAIVRVIYRQCVSRRNLLEWQPAEAAHTHGHAHRRSTYRQTLAIAACSAVLLMGLYAKGAFKSTAVFLGLWIVAPALVRWLAYPDRPTARWNLRDADKEHLRLLARRTWRYFDDLVGPGSNWLPPDNNQLVLRIEVAQRTSPTNIGLWLTSALAATDLGYLSADEFLKRCEHTISTLARLEHYEGHLLNWYDIRTLEPLSPRYVSTVDSGNLLASLWVLKQGCEQLLHRPLIGHACFRGLYDTVSILREEAGGDRSFATPIRELRRSFRNLLEGHHLVTRLASCPRILQRLQETARWHVPGDERSYWASRVGQELDSWLHTMERYVRWMRTLTEPPDFFLRGLSPDASQVRRKAAHTIPSLLELAGGGSAALKTVLGWRGQKDIPTEAAAWLERLAAETEEAVGAAEETVRRFQQLAATCEHMASGINMRFLYDQGRRLFAVGYTVGGPVQFTSHYDLLASECRLASLVAIAKGDAPVQHWYALNRPRVLTSRRHQALLSWSGTMFEYLMPLIFMRTYDNSLLDLACWEAVRQQVAYGEENQIPWGCSESASSALDANQIYQYRAFGVPSLALKPGLEEELVVAPYATVLALLVDPPQAMANLWRLEALGLAGPMGLYEAIDFGRENTEGGEPGVPIYAYMAHHQGMSLSALDDVLHRGVMQQRFHNDVRVRAVESLLFEGIPITPPAVDEFHTNLVPTRVAAAEEPAERTWQKDEAAFPRVHLQGNGRYAIVITAAGGGYSQWTDFDITRRRGDPTLDGAGGGYIYIKDLSSQTVWSAAHQPVSGEAGESSVRFSADRAEFHRSNFGIGTILAVTVAAEDVELRRLTVTNQSRRNRQLELTSYIELAMAPHAWDASHPAFAKMFVQTESLGNDAIIAWRRQRDPGELPIWTAHVVVGASGEIGRETDRTRFLGRSYTPSQLDEGQAELSGSTGTVLDPIFSLSCRLTLKPRDRQEIIFLTIAAPTRDALLAIIEKYRHPEMCAGAFEMAWTRAQLEFRYLGIGPAAAHRFLELAGHLLFPRARFRPLADRLVQNQVGQLALWSYGISGDLPIIAVTIADSRHVPLVRELLLAHTYWRLRGYRADLVILNQEGPSYDRPLHSQLSQIIGAHSTETGVDRPGGVFLRDWHSIPEVHDQLILASASVAFSGARGSLPQQLGAATDNRSPQSPFAPTGGREEPSQPLPFLELPYFNSLGGFTQDGREYAIYLKAGSNTPAPWVNVIANSNFGTIVSESGLGSTWRGNSQSNRLTPWHNDPISDPQSEVIYLRDEETGALWTPTALPIREQDAYRARHGQGYTVFEHNSHALAQELTVFVPSGERDRDTVKICRLNIRNTASHARRLVVTYYAEWVLGTTREQNVLHIQPSYDPECGAILASQSWNGPYSGHRAFAAASPRATSYSADRTQFLGRSGSVAKPAALGKNGLDNRAAAGMDPCAALQIAVNLQPGQQENICFLLGQADSLEQVRALVKRYSDIAEVDAALQQTSQSWEEKLGCLQVKTPLLSVDMLLNRWLPYQVLSCRMWGRSGFYQSSGAYGFRDQLQDCMAWVHSAPELTRQQILIAAARQFIEGDVQHWWHAETGMGVRTRCSDDLVWLPYVLAHYVRVTGDIAILDVEVPFLEGPELGAHETERMFTPAISSHVAPLREHCRLALDRAWRLGPHGLPLFGNGDWNDGMNRVGVEGKGESVWLGWFLYSAFEAFLEISKHHQGEADVCALCRQRALQLQSNLEKFAWDGEWYLRGFFDNGAALGSHLNPEAQIDSIAQSWAVISGAAEPTRARQAMESAQRMLVDEQNQLVKLFTPPFDHSEPHPGYIMGYPSGIRENGGQYTHGSLWMALAWARLGQADRAVQLLTFMNPVEHSRDPGMISRYKGEPYVLAGDVYTAPGHVGQSGWTWYTGSASWMYRIWIEDVLGFRLSGDKLKIAPVIPPDWDGFEIRYRRGSAVYEIEVSRTATSVTTVELDGQPVNDGTITLSTVGGFQRVTVRLPRNSPTVASTTISRQP